MWEEGVVRDCMDFLFEHFLSTHHVFDPPLGTEVVRAYIIVERKISKKIKYIMLDGDEYYGEK